MISIASYMRRNTSPAGTGGATGDSPVLAGLCASILNYIGIYVFTGEFSRYRAQLQEPAGKLTDDLDEAEAARVDESVRTALHGYNRMAQDTLQRTAIEMQQMVGVLGRAFTVLSGGSERSVTRLKGIQDTLRRTSAIQDVAALRASLRDVVQLIGEESTKEQQTTARELEGMEAHVVRFREQVAVNPNRNLRGRDEAIRAISDSRAAIAPDKTVWVIAFLFGQLTAIVKRYGPEAVDDLLLQLIRERLQPVAPGSVAFRWNASSIIGIAELEPDLAALQSKMARLNKSPLVCRIGLGNRTAMLKVGISHLVLEVNAQCATVSSGTESAMSQLIGEIDRFTEALCPV